MTALTDCVVKVFWTRKHLRDVLSRCDVPQSLIGTPDWNAYKYHIVDPILKALNQSEEGLGPLRRVLAETLHYKDCNHLLRWQDGQRLKRDAEASLRHLRLLVEQHDEKFKAEHEEQQRRRAEAESARTHQAFHQKLSGLRDRFLAFHNAADSQARGYQFQTLLYELFNLFDLQPREPFRLRGEEIDGAFVLDGDDFLLEARWRREPAVLSDLRDLDGTVGSNLDNTLGLFISVNGFSDDAIQRYREGNRPRVICMDGADLMLVLEGRVDLAELLRRKRSVAAQRGEVFVSAQRILLGEL
jgi:hypothetical protein